MVGLWICLRLNREIGGIFGRKSVAVIRLLSRMNGPDESFRKGNTALIDLVKTH